MTAALPISHKRLADVIMRYGIGCAITPPLDADKDTPWKINQADRDGEEALPAGIATSKQQAYILLSSVIERAVLQQTEQQKQASALLAIDLAQGEVKHGSVIQADGLSWSVKQLVQVHEGPVHRIYKIELMTNEV